MDALFIERIIVLVLVGVMGCLLLKAVYKLVKFLVGYRNRHGISGLVLLMAGVVLAGWGVYEFFILIVPYLVYILAAVVGYFWFTSNSFRKGWNETKTTNDDRIIQEWERDWDVADINRRNGF